MSKFFFLILLSLGACQKDIPSNHAKAARPPHQVEVVTIAPSTLTASWTRPATLRAIREVRVYTQEQGTLTALPYYESDPVTKDTVLARLDDRVLRAELAKAEATLRQAREDLRRLKGLAKRDLVAKDELGRARTALEVARAETELLRTRIDYTVIRAPFPGVVSARLAEPGDVVASFTHILTLTDLSSLVAEVQVSELWLPSLRVGDTAQIHIDALNLDYSRPIQRIHPTVDPVTRQGTVEVLLDPVPAGASPGQFCRVRFSAPPRRAVLVPFQALQYDTRGEYVYRVEQGKALRTPVTTATGHDQRVEVLAGLTGGEQIVVRGLLGLRDGLRVSSKGLSEP